MLFWYNNDKKGREKVLRERLFESTDRMEQTYVFTEIIKHEDADTIREFGYALLRHNNLTLACAVFHSINDQDGFNKALDKIREASIIHETQISRHYESIGSSIAAKQGRREDYNVDPHKRKGHKLNGKYAK